MKPEELNEAAVGLLFMLAECQHERMFLRGAYCNRCGAMYSGTGDWQRTGLATRAAEVKLQHDRQISVDVARATGDPDRDFLEGRSGHVRIRALLPPKGGR